MINRDLGDAAQDATHTSDRSQHGEHAELLSLRRLVDTVFSATADIYLLIDSEGRVTDYRSGSKSALYVPSAQFLGRRLRDFMPQSICHRYDVAKLRAQKEGQQISFTYPLTIANQPCYFEAWLSYREQDASVSLLIRDVTTTEKLRQSEVHRVKELSGLYFIQQAAQRHGDVAAFSRQVVREVAQAMAEPDSVTVELTLGNQQFRHGEKPMFGHRVVKQIDDGSAVCGALTVQFHEAYMPSDQEKDFSGGVAHAVGFWLRNENALQQLSVFSRIVSSTQDLLALLDVDAQFTVVNEAYAAHVGKVPEELVGIAAAAVLGECHWADYLSHEFAAAVAGEVRQFQEWRDTAAGRRLFHVIYSPLHENGRTTGVVVSAHDITELDQAKLRLRRAARVFSDSSEAVLFLRHDGVIEDANPALVAISGHEISSIVGQDVTMLWAENNSEGLYRDVLSAIKLRGQWRGEVWLRHRDGHSVPGLMTLSATSVTPESPAGDDHGYTIVFTDTTLLKANEERLQRLANLDELTGLLNRHQLMNLVDRHIELSRRGHLLLTVMFIDLDHFKEVNDTLGHSAGDELLKQAGSRLRAVLRGTDVLARVGGDEFVAIFPGIGSGADASRIADKIIATMSQPFFIANNQARVTASVGIASFPEHGDDRETLLRHADIAMYEAKSAGRSAWRCYKADP